MKKTSTLTCNTCKDTLAHLCSKTFAPSDSMSRRLLFFCRTLVMASLVMLISNNADAGVCYTTTASGNWNGTPAFNPVTNITCSAQTTAATIASTNYVQFDGIAGQTYSFTINTGTGWTTPYYEYYQYNGSSWSYVAEGPGPTFTVNCSQTSTPGAGWSLLVIFNGNTCPNNGGPAWPGTSASLTYKRTTGPIPTGASVSNGCWNTNGANTYTVTATAINSNASDFGGNYGILALINEASGVYGGYFSWNTSIANLNAGGYTINQFAATGGGFVGQCPCNGNAGNTLTGGSTSVSGYTRTANFTCVPNTSFPQAGAVNTVGVYCDDPCNQQVGWNSYPVNFGSSYATAATLNTATPPNGSTVCTGYGNVSCTATAGSGGGGSGGSGSDAYQYSINGGSTWSTYTPGTNIPTASATTSIIVQAERVTTCVTSAWSTIATWNIGSATIAPTLNVPSPANGTSVCTSYGNVSATTHAGSGGSTGATDAYQYSINGGSTWNTYTPGTNIPTASATTSIIIQAERTGGSYGCSTAGWNTIATWPISASPTAPTLNVPSPANGTTVCTSYGNVSATTNAGTGGSTGAADSYQYSTNGGSTYSTYTPGTNIATSSATTSIIIQSQRSGGTYGCSATAWTTIATWPIGTAPVAATLNTASPASGSTVCTSYATGVSATANAGSGGSTGAADAYQFSRDGGSTWTSYTPGTTITTASATGNIIVQAERTGGSYGCTTTAWSTIATWILASSPVAPTLNVATPASGSAVCTSYGNVSATTHAGSGGSTGAADAYQYSTNGGSTWSTYTPGNNIPTASATTSIIVQAERTGGSYGCSTTAWSTIATWTISPSPIAPALNTATPPTGSTVCTSYGNVSATGNAGTGGSTGAADAYQYSTNGGSTWSTYTSGTNIATSGATGNIIVQSQRSGGSYGCSASAWSTIATWILGVSPTAPTLNTATPSNGTTLCVNYGNVKATANAGSGGSTGAADAYQYSTNGGSTWSSYTPGTNIATSGSTTSIIVQAERTGGSYGCSTVGWNTIATWPINQIPTPTFTTTPTNPICTYTNATYTTQSGQSSYVWGGLGTVGVDYNVISGGTSSTDATVTIQWISTGTKTVTVGYTSGACASTSPASFTTVVDASPTPSISTSGSNCVGGTFTYTTQSGQSNYTWTIPGTLGTDYTIAAGGTTSDDYVEVQWITPGTYAVTVNYTNSNGCYGPVVGSNTSTFGTAPSSAALSSVIDPCNGGHTTVVNITGGTSPYSFKLTPPGTFFTSMPAYSEVDGDGASSVSVSNIADANGCPPATVTGTNPVTLGSYGLSLGGDSADCMVGAGSTQIFFDHSAQLMAKVQSTGATLGSTGVTITKDGSVQDFGPTHLQHYLQRHFEITPTNNNPANVCLYISDAEADALNTASSGDQHTAPAYYGTFPASTSTNAVFGGATSIMKYDGSSETPASHSAETVISTVTATHNPTVDGYTYSGVWQVCFSVGSFSGFYIYAGGTTGDPLPVTLVSFTADAVNNQFIQLNWVTASEINNSGFQVERSIDGTTYQAIGWVDGHGNSTVTNDYQISDMTAVPGIVYYYRLKQVDVDGNFAYSNIVSASLIGDKGFTLTGMYPNPATSQVSIGVISNISSTATVRLTDVLGRDVMVQDWPLSVGYNTNVFDISTVAAGTYVVTIQSGNIKASKHLVIAR